MTEQEYGAATSPGRNRRSPAEGAERSVEEGDVTSSAARLLELRIGTVAHGGHCVARYEGRVVFVRHALPGELVRARITESGDGKRFWRADAVEVLEPAPGRVPVRCPISGPGGCGGCDWQHADLTTQRELKATVVAEQLLRLAGLEWPVEVEAVHAPPADDGLLKDGLLNEGLGWRSRVHFAVAPDGRPGLRRHRSHAVVPVPAETGCPIGRPEVNGVGLAGRRLSGVAAADVVAPSDSGVLVVLEPTGQGRAKLPETPDGTSVAVQDADRLTRVRGRTWVSESVLVGGRPKAFRVTGAGFWQIHPGAPQTFLDAVLAAAAPRPGERALDLYSGVGLFAAGLAEAVGVRGSVVSVESDARAGADARRNLHDLPQVRCVTDRVDRYLRGTAGDGDVGAPDVVVLDPPRTGAGPAVLTALLARRPRVVVYVACDPAALARDLAAAAGAGYRLDALRAFDAFPMTHHVECVATLVPAGPSDVS